MWKAKKKNANSKNKVAVLKSEIGMFVNTILITDHLSTSNITSHVVRLLHKRVTELGCNIKVVS